MLLKTTGWMTVKTRFTLIKVTDDDRVNDSDDRTEWKRCTCIQLSMTTMMCC